MALGSGISVSVGGNSRDTVHVNNQPMIVLLVPFRKGGCIRGRVGLGKRGTHQDFLHTCFSCPVCLDILILNYFNPHLCTSSGAGQQKRGKCVMNMHSDMLLSSFCKCH